MTSFSARLTSSLKSIAFGSSPQLPSPHVQEAEVGFASPSTLRSLSGVLWPGGCHGSRLGSGDDEAGALETRGLRSRVGGVDQHLRDAHLRLHRDRPPAGGEPVDE
ncbi:hypothetical protein B296_00009211 [Ensete ventricosum]|uniref:Uncharacterized protein n=1 Tax=Ensete ventricosum TaxID=4639 RepID=A0A427ANQ6_ENSVE|nr:hypothetical protein B296_00009211 [Ensete ventricosum]